MEKTIPPSVLILVVGLAPGLLGLMLFSGTGAGLNVALYALLVVAAVALMNYAGHASPITARWPLLGLLVLFAGGFAWRDSTTLHWLACGAALLIALILRLGSGGRSLAACGSYEAGAELGRTLTSLFTTAPRLMRHDVPWQDVARGRSEQFRAVGHGLLGVVPVLLVFGSLLTSADARFETFTADLIDWDVVGIVRRLVIFAGCFALAAAVMKWCVSPSECAVGALPRVNWRAGGIEVNIVLTALNALFFSYLAVQVSYFFGDDALVQGRNALSYSSYARRGFFELVWLSVLLLPTLLVARWLLRNAGPIAARVYRLLAGGLVGLVLIIVASAMHRMHLYVDAYGLTELRFYSSVFMLWITVIYAWFCASILICTPQRFVSGVVVSALITVGALYIANPDGFIARTNIDRLAQTNRLDDDYLVSLSSDAVPVLLESFAHVATPRANSVVAKLRRKHALGDADGWRGWNLSRTQARESLTHGGGEAR